MIVGVIRTRDVIFHPVSVFSIQGFRGFLRVLFRAFCKRKYRFVDLIEITTRTFVGKKAK